jgi:uncharacterized protein
MFFWGFYLDPLYILLFIATLVISGGSQMYIQNTFRAWSRVANRAGLTGQEVGQRLVASASFGGATGAATGIRFQEVPGQLSDAFDPRNRTVGLSAVVGRQASVAAMAVAAHEVGHAQQHAEGTVAMKARSFLVPALTFSPTLSYICILFGLIFNLTGLFYLGIVFFALMVLFTLLTLPVEIGASRRAVVMLRGAGLFASAEEETGVRKVLTAAALTYVAAAVTSILTLLYYISLARRSS